MAKKDIIVVGASAGGVEALLNFVKSLPCQLDAAIFVVLHVSAVSKSNLPGILSRAGPLPAQFAQNGDKVTMGKIYVAPGDHHLLFAKGNTLLLKKGRQANRFCPSVDKLFHSAALVYGPRVIGVVLSGMLNDGTWGMWQIRQHGGITIVQDPEEALFPSMPKSVLEYMTVNYSLPADAIGSLLATLTAENAPIHQR